MREVTVTTKIYGFDELSEDAKAVAVQAFSDVNIDQWWDCVYEEALTIGLKITESNAHSCSGTWTMGAEEVAALILEHHGDVCETHKDATTFLADLSKAQVAFENAGDYGADYETFDESDEYGEMCSEFKKTICEDYRILLQNQYEYLCSTAAIIETIQANEYEFRADGKHYSKI